MKRILPPLVLLLAILACTLPNNPLSPTATPPPPSATPLPPTPTHTPVPTPTPTPLPAVRVAAGDQALFYGDWEAAASAYNAALAASSDVEIQAAALLGQGRILYLNGDYPNALDALRVVIAAYPDTIYAAEAHFYLGEIFMALDRYLEAAEAYASYRNLRPGLLDAFISERRADALFAAADYAGALAEYSLATQASRLPTDFSLELKLAHAYTLTGDYATALVAYDDIYARTGNDYIKAQVDYLKGQTLVLLGRYDEGYTAYLEAVNAYPLSYYAYLSLIELVNAGYPVDELQRGLVDYYAGEYDVALAAFDRYLQSTVDGDPATALYYEGIIILRAQLDPARAIALWDQVIQNYANHPLWDEAWEQKAYTQWAYQDDYAGGQQTLLDFVAASPSHPRAAEFLFDAARVAERDGRLAEAAGLWQRIPGEYPASEYVYRSMFLAGISYYRQGDYAGAQNVFWQAQGLALSPFERSGAFFWLGKTYAMQGDANAARLAWEQAAAIDPTGFYSERARDLLLDRLPFTPPEVFDLGMDRAAEILQAEEWLRTTFALPESADLTVPGPLGSDPRVVRGQELWRLGQYEQAAAEFESLRTEVATDPVNTYRLAILLGELGLYRPSILAARQVQDLAGLDDAGTLQALPCSTISALVLLQRAGHPGGAEYGFHPCLCGA
jgi:soluble lytic murein transglycosylase